MQNIVWLADGLQGQGVKTTTFSGSPKNAERQKEQRTWIEDRKVSETIFFIVRKLQVL